MTDRETPMQKALRLTKNALSLSKFGMERSIV